MEPPHVADTPAGPADGPTVHGTEHRDSVPPAGRRPRPLGGDEGAPGSSRTGEPGAPLERVAKPADLGAYLDRTAELVFLGGDYTGQAWLELDRRSEGEPPRC